MHTAARLFRFLERLTGQKFYGIVTIRFERGKAVHIEAQTKQAWEYKNLPVGAKPQEPAATRQ